MYKTKGVEPENRPPGEDEEEYTEEEELAMAEWMEPENHLPREDEEEYTEEEELAMAEWMEPENRPPGEDEEEYTEEEELAMAEWMELENRPPGEDEEEYTEEEELAMAEWMELENHPPGESEEQGSDRTVEKEQIVKAQSRMMQGVDMLQNPYERYDDAPNVYVYFRELISRYKFRYVHDPAMGEPLSFDNGKYWQPMTDEWLFVMIFRVLKEGDKKRIYNCKIFCANVASFIKLHCAQKYYDGERFTEKQFKEVQNHAVFRNGVYDAQKGRFVKFDTKLPYTFGLDAEYIAEDVETEAWDKLRIDASGDKDSMDMLAYWVGYLEVPNMTAKAMAVMASAKDSGKSIFGQFCAGMYEGSRTEAMDPDKLSGRFTHARAATTLLLYCFELNTEQMKASDVAELKKITGERTIRSEAKYQMAVTMPLRFKVMLATNTGLYLGKGVQQDDAFYRRVIVLPFIHSRERGEIMDDMLDRLNAERSAILSKCVRRLHEIIKPDGGIAFPESELSRSIKTSWSERIDMVKMFMDATLDVTGNLNDFLIKEEIYNVYEKFAHEKSVEVDIQGCPILTKNACIARIMELAGGKVRQSKIRSSTCQPNRKYFPDKQMPCLRGVKWKGNPV